MKIQSHNRSVAIALLLSLLLHFGMCLLLFLQQKGLLFIDNAEQQEQIQSAAMLQDDAQWIATQARQSDFGAPVMFYDEPEQEQNESQKSQDSVEQTVQHKTAFTDAQVQPLEQSSSNAELSESEQPYEPSWPETSVQSHVPKSVINIPQTKPTEASSTQLATAVTSTRHLSQPHSAPVKKIPTLAQLTQGFLNQPKSEGKHSVTMLGKKEGVMTDEQMRYERYLQKLSWCIQNSLNINSNRLPWKESVEIVIEVILALNKDGSIRQLQLTKSSGNIRFDQFALFILKDASTSFPPVPDYLPHDPFAIAGKVTFHLIHQNNVTTYRY